MVILFTLFTVLAQLWIDRLQQQTEQVLRDYHLANTAHYLSAEETLRNMQLRLVLANQEGHQAILGRELSRVTLAQLVFQDIRRAEVVQSQLGQEKFAGLVQIAVRRSHTLVALAEGDPRPGVLLNTIQSLLDTLEQLIRLHAIGERVYQRKLQEQKVTHTYGFLSMAVLLLFTALWLARRSFRSVNRIIQSQQRKEETIRRQAHFDALTQLPNRLLFNDRLEHTMAEATRHQTRLALLYLDLDDFKKINDTLGHDMGDQLLMEVAGRLTGLVRQSDTVARLGGDEFVMILGDADSEIDVQHVAEKVTECIAQPVTLAGRLVTVSSSVGIALYPDDADSAKALMSHADSAMYHAKHSGKNTFSFFSASMNADAIRRLVVEEQMQHALKNNEFYPVYQAKFACPSRRLMGAEVLLRWHNPTLGQVSPAEFIPLAEHLGLIEQIGQYVLDTALSDSAAWIATYGQPFTIAVNLSPRQFRSTDLVSKIGQSLKRVNLPAEVLELEITEGVLLASHSNVDKALQQLSQMGITISMDDFGTGYSSLSNLRTHPFDVLKIDQSFVRDVADDPKDRELVHAAISLAHGLKLEVVAEGIETQEQLDILESLGIDIGQGYFFARPLARHEFTALLAEHYSQHSAAPSAGEQLC